MGLDLLRKVSTGLIRLSRPKMTPAKEEKILKSFKEPTSDCERSWLQYRCQSKQNGWLHTLVANLASAAMLPISLLKYGKKPDCEKSCSAVFAKHQNAPDNIIPDCLREELRDIELDPSEGMYLNREDKKWIRRVLWRHPFSPAFAFKMLLKAARYRYLIEKYRPHALIVHNEFSFTSSLMTEFCEGAGVELINVMHGEKLYDIRDSFFRFSRCYVWNEFYRELFVDLRAEPSQFTVAVPPSLLFTESCVDKTVDFTYYLQDQTGEELRRVLEIMAKLREQGSSVSVRPHPRFTDFNELDALAEEMKIEVEDWREMTVEHSVLRSVHAISLFSTVLLQAYYNGTVPVVDDISRPRLIEDLRAKKYIILSLDHKTVSELMEKKHHSEAL